MATEVVPNMTAFAHIIVVDKSLYRQYELGLKVISLAMRSFNLHKLHALIPTTRPLAIRYAEFVGFGREGLLHSALRYNGQWTDAVLLGRLEDT
jgi:L-amino acid N-acyltransferase YncA